MLVQMSCLPIHIPQFFHWIKEWSSCGRTMEYLDSYGPKVYMNGPIVRVGRRKKQKHRHVVM